MIYPELNVTNLKQAIADIYWEDYNTSLLEYLSTDNTDTDTNSREDLYLAFFPENLSMDFEWRNADRIRVWTWWKVNSHTNDWASIVLTYDIDREFVLTYEEFNHTTRKREVVSEELLLQEILETLQNRHKECIFFTTNFIS